MCIHDDVNLLSLGMPLGLLGPPLNSYHEWFKLRSMHEIYLVELMSNDTYVYAQFLFYT
jgi:hypothetical protein